MVAKKPSTLSSAPPQLTQRDVNRPRPALKAQNAAAAASPSLPSSSRKMVPQSSAHAKAKAATTVESLNKCNSCGKCVSASSSQVDAICCAKCNHVYHGRCFRPAHFVGDAASATASDRCLNCESGSYQHDLLINIKRHKSTNPLEVAARDLLTKGFAVTSIGDVPRAVLESTRANVNALFSGLLLAYETALMSGATVPTLETGYTNFRQRGLGRYEMIAPEITVPFFQALCGPGTPLRDLIDLVLPPLTCPAGSLGPLTDVVEFASGIIYSTSGAAGQNWHTDGPAVSDVAEATLPYAVNIFVPLIDMGPVNGTQFVEGSQCPLFAAKDGQPETRVSPEVRLGEAMLFDYRVLHRGLPNQGSLPRPCMYITFARRWYRGDMNFSKSRYRGHLKPFATTTSTRGAKN